MQITSAMKMVSAAKLKRAQDAILQMRPYSDKLTELLNNLISSIDSSENNIYSKKRKLNSVLLVTITSNRGLCGGFNSFIIKQAKALIKNEYKNTNVSILSIGKKSSEHFTKTVLMWWGLMMICFQILHMMERVKLRKNNDRIC